MRNNVGSIPASPTLNAPVAQLVEVTSLSLVLCGFESRQEYSGLYPTSPCSPTGRGGGLRNRWLLVRVQPRVLYLVEIDINMVSEVEAVETLVCEASKLAGSTPVGHPLKAIAISRNKDKQLK